MIWAVVAVFVAAYILIASERVNRTAVAVGGAGLIVAMGVLGSDELFYSRETGIDWDVIFLLFGMMVIVGVLKQTGVFEFLAIWAAKRAGGQPYRVMVLLCLLTAGASALLDNVTTVLLMAPVTFLVCDRIGVRPEPYLISQVLASNIGGTATLVGDPPNIIIASRADLSFTDFLVHLAPVALVVLVIFIGMCRFLFRSAFEQTSHVSDLMQLRERDAINDPALLRRCAVVLAGVLVGFVFHPVLHVEPSLVALLGAGVLVALSRLSPSTYLDDVEWETLVFFAGLFIMVGALVHVGAIDSLARFLTDLSGGELGPTVMALLFGSAILSAIVDNIPYVATMAPVVATLTAPGSPLEGEQVLWWALALGADFGGNATAIGASANVVVLGIAKRNGHPISFWMFTKYGLVVTAMSIAVSAVYLQLRYL